MNPTKLCLSIVILIVVAPLIMALPPSNQAIPEPTTASMTRDLDTWIDANRVLMFTTNVGSIAYDASSYFGYGPGLFWPFTSLSELESGDNRTSPLYAGGLWIGGVNSLTGDTLVCIAEFGQEYTPGPVIGGTYAPDSETNPAYRVYKLYADSLGDHPNQDYLQWPVAQGALVTFDGEPVMIGDQMMWTVFNDLDPDNHQDNSGHTDPLMFEIRQTVFAFDDNPNLEDVVFVKYAIFNHNPVLLENVIFSFWFDPDVGGSPDDLVGCDTLLSLGYAYNADNDDTQYGVEPPALGVAILQGPMVPTNDLNEEAWMWGQQWPKHKNLGMSAFAKYINGTDPDNYRETFYYMNGLLKDGSPYQYNGHVLKYMHSGNPVIGTGDLDMSASDKRMMLSCGPISLDYHDSTEVILAIMVGQGTDRLNSISTMAGQYGDAQTVAHSMPAQESLTNLCKWERSAGGNDHWYAVMPELLFWEDAVVAASEYKVDFLSGYLATITSADENAFILDNVLAGTHSPGVLDELWLGGRDVDGVWTWVTNDEPFAFTNWAEGEPNNPGYETALLIWGPNTVYPFREHGTWNNAMPNVFKFWSVVEWSIPPVAVSLDIAPGVCPNFLDINKGRPEPTDDLNEVKAKEPLAMSDPSGTVNLKPYLTAAILGTETFDVTQINLSSVRLQGCAPARLVVKDVGAPASEACVCETTEPDGIPDLKFILSPYVVGCGLGEVEDGDTVMVTVTGYLYDDTPIVGHDCVIIIDNEYTEVTETDIEIAPEPGLTGNYPNPFNPGTNIDFVLSAGSHVSLDVYNVMGQKVTTLIDGYLEVGEHRATWDGSRFASGVYFYRLQTDSFSDTRKMVLVK